MIGTSLILWNDPLYDYPAYQKQWEMVLQGDDPWQVMNGRNAYGPIYNLMAYLYDLHPKWPHLIFFFSLMASFYLASKHGNYEKVASPAILLSGAILLPYVYLMTISYGVNDCFLAAITVFGLLAYHRGQFLLSGSLMSMAILFKFMPVFMLPFLIISSRVVNWRFLVGLGITSLVLAGASYWFWEGSFTDAILFGGSRQSKMLSIFRFLRGPYSPLHLVMESPDLDFLSFPLILGSIALLFFLHLRRGYHSIQSAVLALSLAIQFYQVGHPQFYLTLVMILFTTYTMGLSTSPASGPAVWTTALFALSITAVTLMREFTGFQGDWVVVRHLIGLPMFVIHSLFNWHLYKGMTEPRLKA